MTRLGWLAFLGLAAACSSLPTVGNGIVALQIHQPASLTLARGDSVKLVATAFNVGGDSVPQVIQWLTPDTTITVSSLGLVTALDSTGTGRVRAVAGTLVSDYITFSLTPKATGTTSRRAR